MLESWEEILNLILAIIIAISELLPFIDSLQGNGILHSILSKKKKDSSNEPLHLIKEQDETQ
jgi:hypothetical protein